MSPPDARVRVEELVTEIRRAKNGDYSGTKSGIIVRKNWPDDYEMLLQTLRYDAELYDYFRKQTQYKYQALPFGRAQLTIHVHSAFHKTMVTEFNRHFQAWLGGAKDNKLGISDIWGRDAAIAVAGMALGIQTLGPTSVRLGGETFSVDHAYGYWRGARTSVPTMIVDVTCSERTGDLRRRVEDLLRRGRGDIYTVVALNFSDVCRARAASGNPERYALNPRESPNENIQIHIFRAGHESGTFGRVKIVEEEISLGSAGDGYRSNQPDISLSDLVPEDAGRDLYTGCITSEYILRTLAYSIDWAMISQCITRSLFEQKWFEKGIQSQSGDDSARH